MVDPKDVKYHAPQSGDYIWAETNFFSFYVPERHICGSVYVVTRQALGVAMADVTLFDKLSLDRKQCLHINCRQHLPAPEDLADYTLPLGLSVKATKPPTDYAVSYRGHGDVSFDFEFAPIMPPHDLHGAHAAKQGSDFDFQCYKGHFDLSGRVTGELRIAGETIPINCLDTMDHSWGPRPEDGMGIAGGCWMHAHFEPGYVVHALFIFDGSKPLASQYTFTRGYVLEDGKVWEASEATLHAVRINDLGVALDLDLMDSRGKSHRLLGAALSGTNILWYSSMDIFYALHRWTAQDGRVGYGCAMESFSMPTMAGRQGLALPNIAIGQRKG